MSYDKLIVDAYCDTKDNVARIKNEIKDAKKMLKGLEFAACIATEMVVKLNLELKNANDKAEKADLAYQAYCAKKEPKK